jgi:hypothetical protein
MLSLPPRRSSVLASGALVLAIGAIACAFLLGTTHSVDAQFMRTNVPQLQPRASSYYWATGSGNLDTVASSTTATCQTGYRVVSGGYRAYASDEQVSIYVTAPFEVNRGWEIRGTSSRKIAILVYAHCVSV